MGLFRVSRAGHKGRVAFLELGTRRFKSVLFTRTNKREILRIEVEHDILFVEIP